MHIPIPVCHTPTYSLSTHTLCIHSSDLREQHHPDQNTMWPLQVSHCFFAQPPTSSANVPTCSSPASTSLSLAVSLTLNHTEQISSLRKPSLTHPTPSLPSSHHHLAILCFQKE